MRYIRIFILLVVLIGYSINTNAQQLEQAVKVMISPDHADWTYHIGENVKFSVSVYKHNNLVKGVKIQYEIGPEKLAANQSHEEISKTGTMLVEAKGLRTSGFLRIVVSAELDGRVYRGLATAGFDPEKIQPTVQMPTDFESFWSNAKTALSKIPFDVKSTLLPEKCTEKVNVYHVSLQNIGNSRVYGILCVPKADGHYPAVLEVPGAGVRGYTGNISLAEKGVITLQIGIHGLPVMLDPLVYTSLWQGALSRYWNNGLDDRDQFYYKRVYLGCIRANDFLVSLPQFDQKNLAVQGASQGGALSIVTASLDPRIKYLSSFYPALSDMTGYLFGRAGGWPHYLDSINYTVNATKEKLKVIPYYDVVNFAKKLKVPGIYSWGFNDETCPPTSIFAVYNSISAPKDNYIAQDTGHWTYKEQQDYVGQWLLSKIKER